MEGLTKAVASVGLKAEGIQVGRNALPDTQMPAIGWYHGNHYVAVLELNGRGESGTATIRDPDSSKEETILQEALLRRTSGYLLLVHR
jgi:ABC-type bacteriocin/lantibiotic exporter with double-glycine peptidase domain